MRFLQELPRGEVQEAIGLLVEDNRPLALTIRHRSRWVALRTRAVARLGDALWVALPSTDQLLKPVDFPSGERVGVTFTAAQRKFIFAARVICVETFRLDESSQLTALKLTVPDRMQKIERRLRERVELAAEKLARAAFWLGGQESRPVEERVDAPVWSGRILNISSGGMLVRTSYEAAKYVDLGDILGVHLLLGGQDHPIFLDAQVRHIARDGEMALIGLQFVDVEEVPENRAALDFIRLSIAETAARSKAHGRSG